jgi:hypothetical protein
MCADLDENGPHVMAYARCLIASTRDFTVDARYLIHLPDPALAAPAPCPTPGKARSSGGERAAVGGHSVMALLQAVLEAGSHSGQAARDAGTDFRASYADQPREGGRCQLRERRTALP